MKIQIWDVHFDNGMGRMPRGIVETSMDAKANVAKDKAFRKFVGNGILCTRIEVFKKEIREV